MKNGENIENEDFEKCNSKKKINKNNKFVQTVAHKM
jgi:hypothetical protein